MLKHSSTRYIWIYTTFILNVYLGLILNQLYYKYLTQNVILKKVVGLSVRLKLTVVPYNDHKREDEGQGYELTKCCGVGRRTSGNYFHNKF